MDHSCACTLHIIEGLNISKVFCFTILRKNITSASKSSLSASCNCRLRQLHKLKCFHRRRLQVSQLGISWIRTSDVLRCWAKEDGGTGDKAEENAEATCVSTTFEYNWLGLIHEKYQFVFFFARGGQLGKCPNMCFSCTQKPVIHCPWDHYSLQIEAGIMSYTRLCLDLCGSLCVQIGRASSSKWLPKP